MEFGGEVRTRFAPSPTGSLHVGGARTALFNYLFAKKNQGKFILRVEDTDVVRSTDVSENAILEDLKWLGLLWDEGPGKPESPESLAYGPYRQSERLIFYGQSLLALQEKGCVYPCYCTEEELSSKRKASLEAGQTPRYDGRCRTLAQKEIARLESEKRIPAWRFNIESANPASPKTITVHDLIRGDVVFETNLIGDFVLMKSNAFPSYNFACVVDDHHMEISHVIRGDEHLTNTPRQILLYQALGWKIPQFAHLPMILAPDHTKLSKRHGTTAVAEFKDKGCLPHAILNYTALLGWSPKDEREIFCAETHGQSAEKALSLLLKELGQSFSLEGVSKNPAIFDTAKLSWMNSEYIRLLQPEQLFPLLTPLFHEEKVHPPEEGKLLQILSTQRQNFQTLLDAVNYFREFYSAEKITLEETAREVLSWSWSSQIVSSFEKQLEEVAHLTPEAVSPLMKRIQVETGKKGKELYWPIRVAVTGKTHGPEFLHLFPILGKEELLRRLSQTKLWF